MPVNDSAAKVLAESLALGGNSLQDRAREAAVTKQRLSLWEQQCRHADADKLSDTADSQQRDTERSRDYHAKKTCQNTRNRVSQSSLKLGTSEHLYENKPHAHGGQLSHNKI